MSTRALDLTAVLGFKLGFANEEGIATARVPLMLGLQGLTVFFQAVDPTACRVSNLVRCEISLAGGGAVPYRSATPFPR
jgi:hypothetical protein